MQQRESVIAHLCACSVHIYIYMCVCVCVCVCVSVWERGGVCVFFLDGEGRRVFASTSSRALDNDSIDSHVSDWLKWLPDWFPWTIFATACVTLVWKMSNMITEQLQLCFYDIQTLLFNSLDQMKKCFFKIPFLSIKLWLSVRLFYIPFLSVGLWVFLFHSCL